MPEVDMLIEGLRKLFTEQKRDGFYIKFHTTRRTVTTPVKLIRGNGRMRLKIEHDGETLTRPPRFELWVEGEMIRSAALVVDTGEELINVPLKKGFQIDLGFNMEFD